jgi:hypothetical protein
LRKPVIEAGRNRPDEHLPGARIASRPGEFLVRTHPTARLVDRGAMLETVVLELLTLITPVRQMARRR